MWRWYESSAARASNFRLIDNRKLNSCGVSVLPLQNSGLAFPRHLEPEPVRKGRLWSSHLLARRIDITSMPRAGVLQDRTFTEDGQMDFEIDGARRGRQMETLTVNGAIDPYVDVPSGLVRIRRLVIVRENIVRLPWPPGGAGGCQQLMSQYSKTMRFAASNLSSSLIVSHSAERSRSVPAKFSSAAS